MEEGVSKIIIWSVFTFIISIYFIILLILGRKFRKYDILSEVSNIIHNCI